VAGKQKLLSLGTCPDVSLARARERRDEAPRLVAICATNTPPGRAAIADAATEQRDQI